MIPYRTSMYKTQQKLLLTFHQQRQLLFRTISNCLHQQQQIHSASYNINSRSGTTHNTNTNSLLFIIVRKSEQHTVPHIKRQFSSSTDSNSISAKISNIYESNDQQQLEKNDTMYCTQLVKERDYENGYICGLLLPNHMQSSYFAIRAFNVEIASIKDTSSKVRYNNNNNDDNENQSHNNPFEARTTAPPSILALQLRIQWWRNAIDIIYQNVTVDTSITATSIPKTTSTKITNLNDLANPLLKQQQSNLRFESSSFISSDDHYWKNPIVRSLHRAVQTKHLSKRLLECIVDIREHDLYIDQYNTVQECCNYADETISNLLLLSLECCNNNIRNRNNIDDIVTCAGIGIGLTTLLRATPYRLLLSSASASSVSSNDVPLPAELFRPNYPYQNIISTFMSTANTTTDSGLILDATTKNIDPKIQLKLQRHIQSEVLSDDDRVQFMNAIQTISNLCIEKLSYSMKELSSKGRNISHVEKMCFLSIIPNINYLSTLRNRYHYNIFEGITTTSSASSRPQHHDRTTKFNMAKDRISLFYQLTRTWMTGIY